MEKTATGDPGRENGCFGHCIAFAHFGPYYTQGTDGSYDGLVTPGGEPQREWGEPQRVFSPQRGASSDYYTFDPLKAARLSIGMWI